MRVTEGMLNSQVLHDIQNNYQRMSKLQNEASTGKKINQPSDSPVGVQDVMRYNQQIASDKLYQQNAQNAQSQLNVVSSTMNSAQHVLSRARDLAVQASNGTNTKSDLQTTASEVGQLYNQMVTIGNTEYNHQYIFGGTDNAKPPYPVEAENETPDKAMANSTTDPAQVTTGTGQVPADLGNGITLSLSTSGNDFYGSPSSSTNTFHLLGQLYTALQNGDTTQVGSLLKGIDTRLNLMSQSQADVGARTNRAQLMQTRMSDLSTNVTKQLSNTQDADMASVITQLNSAMAVQQESLKVGAQALPKTLVDFLS